MEIIAIKTSRLRNNEHFSYMTEIKNIIELAGSKYLDIEHLFVKFTELYNNEKDILKEKLKIHSSSSIEDSDSKRDDYYKSIELIITGYLKHPNADIHDSAKNLIKVYTKYGDLRHLSYEDETAALFKFCKEMEVLERSLEKLHLVEWINMLIKENETIQTLIDEFKQNTLEKKNTNLKGARLQLDKSYEDIVSKINALSLVYGERKYTQFASEVNDYIDKQNKITYLKDSSKTSQTKLEKHFPEAFY